MDAPVAGFLTETVVLLLLLILGPPAIQKHTETEATRTLDSPTFTLSLPRPRRDGTTGFRTQSPGDTTTSTEQREEGGGIPNNFTPRKYEKEVFNKRSKTKKKIEDKYYHRLSGV